MEKRFLRKKIGMILFIGILLTILALQVDNPRSILPKEKQDFDAYTQEIKGTDVGIDMVPVEGGIFEMGSNVSDTHHQADEAPAHQVEVSSFWMGKYEITWNQYELYMNSDAIDLPEDLKNEAADAVSRPSKTYFDPSLGMGKDGYPAISMTQFAALAFCRWLTLMTDHFYRLPTEAEWEYAARAGTATAYSFGNDVSKLDGYAWYQGNSKEKYHKVGNKKPNPWGLYDMHGNVAEWTIDQYRQDFYANFKGKIAKDPWAVPEKLYPRTVRGGSWNDPAEELRSAARLPSDPKRWKRHDPQIPKSLWWNTNAPFVGFRIIRPLHQPSKEEMDEFWKKTLDRF